MAEDISAQARTGVTIMALAALVAVVLNIMVIAQSIVSTGMGTLQSGIESVKLQEYEVYNNKRVTGVQVKTALNLYLTRDTAILVGTKNSLGTSGSGFYFNYGALVTGSTAGTDASHNIYKLNASTLNGYKQAGVAWYVTEYQTDTYSVIQHHDDIKCTTLNGDNQFIEDAGTFEAQLIKNKTNSIIGIAFKQVKQYLRKQRTGGNCRWLLQE